MGQKFDDIEGSENAEYAAGKEVAPGTCGIAKECLPIVNPLVHHMIEGGSKATPTKES